MEGFGQTETTMTIGTFPWMEPKPGSMGVPNPAYDMDLITGDGRSAEDGEQGEIVLRTDRVKPLGLFKEYYRDVEKTKEVYSDNVYHTGDIAWRDEDGYYWFVGRTDDVIKSSGYRIGPFEVESALMTHPAVVECAITGVPDEVRGQVVKATIVLAKAYKDKAGEELVKEIQNHVKKTTAPYKYPRVVEFVEELRKNLKISLDLVMQVSPFDVCIIGGGVADWMEEHFYSITEGLGYPIIRASLGNSAGIYGAYAHYIKR